MMMASLPLWARRLAAIGLLVLAAVALYGLVVAPVLHQREGYRLSHAQAAALLERYQEVVAREAALLAERSALEEDSGDRALYLDGDNDTVAGSALQERIRRVIERNGGSVRSMQLLPASAEDRFRRIGARIVAQLDQPQLAAILYDIETERPLLFVDNLDVRRSGRRVRGAAARREVPRELDVDLSVWGLLPAREG